MDDLLLPPTDRRGPTRQLTSRGEPSLVQRWLPAHVRDWSRKCRTLPSREEVVAADVQGTGVVTRLFVAFPALWRPSLYRALRMRIHWDGNDAPAIDVPVGDFFGVHGGRYRQYDSRLASVISGGMVCHAPMPFSRGFRLSFFVDDDIDLPLFFYGVTWSELDPADVSPLRLHAAFRAETPVAPGIPFTFLDTGGSGYYVGLQLATQNRDRWWLSAPTQWLFPRGFGLGQLEGEEELFIDDETESRVRGTGHEEYFNAGWYFRNGRYTGLDSGCLHRSYLTGSTASYRWHWRDPVPFRSRFRGLLHHGIGDAIPADYAATAFWYLRNPG